MTDWNHGARHEMLKLRMSGLRLEDLAARFGCSVSTIIYQIRKTGAQRAYAPRRRDGDAARIPDRDPLLERLRRHHKEVA